jgi:hypothetical protein
MRISIFILFIFSLILIISCKYNIIEQAQTPVASECNNLPNCSGNGVGEYCTFGYKWGANNPFTVAGFDKPGPSSGKIQVSYKFIDTGFTFNTHSQNDVKSIAFDEIVSCSKQTIRDSFAEWESNADIQFIEKTGNDQSDIKLIVANITQGGIGYPPVPQGLCSGLIIFQKFQYTCSSFRILALHEIGHVLGLGHVNSENVMNPNKKFLNLQSGDIKGIQSIYGKR